MQIILTKKCGLSSPAGGAWWNCLSRFSMPEAGPWVGAGALFSLYLSSYRQSEMIATGYRKILTRTIHNFIFHLCQYKEKRSRGITRNRALHLLHSARLKREYPRPDVSLSKEKKKHIRKKKSAMLSLKRQPHLDAQSSRASAASAAGASEICKISGLGRGRLFMSSTLHPSYLHQHSPRWLIDSNTALASFRSEANVRAVHALPAGGRRKGWGGGGGVGSQSSIFPV